MTFWGMTLTRRQVLFGLFVLVLLGASSGLLIELIAFSLANAHSSHVILIPFVSATLIYLNRREIFSEVRYSLPAGGIMMVAGVVLFIAGTIVGARLIQLDYLALMSPSVVLLWLGCFLLFCGTAAFRAALFPLLFLVFMIPIPSLLMERLIQFLQKGSTEVVAVLFALSGTPVYREGFQFSLPGLVIEVAKPCSGVRSSLALLITGLLAGHLFLRTGWGRLTLILAVFPIAMFKNAIRIVTLSLLAVNVDPRIITSRLHQEGGIPFFILALALLSPVLGILRKSERKASSPESALRAIDNLRLSSGDFRQDEINPSSVVDRSSQVR
jgi:exosortase